MILRYSLAWIPMVFLAILNGTLRQFGYGRVMSDLHANQVSCFTGVALFTAYTWLLNRLWPLASAQVAIVVGVIWLTLTVAFEFAFGRYAARKSWELLLQDYNLLAGRLWPLVLLAVALLPLTVFWLCRTG